MNTPTEEHFFTNSKGVVELSPTNFDRTPFCIKIDNNAGLKDCGFVYYYAHWCPHCVKSKEIISATAAKNPHAFVAAFSCKSSDNEGFYNSINGTGTNSVPGFIKTFPTIVFYSERDGVLKYSTKFDPDANERSLESLTQFLIDNDCGA